MNTLPDFPEKLWTVRDVAAFARCSVSWIYKACERNELPHVRVGAMVRFDPSEVRKFIAARSVPASSAP